MKKSFRRNQIIFLLITFVFLISLNAQSDYEIVQNFKQKYKQLDESIKSAKSLEELNSLVANIDRFRNEYLAHKQLLDKSLYPDNFDKSFENLNLAFVIRNQDFTTIDVLQTENIQLKEQVALLNKRNTELMNKIQEYEYANRKNSKKVAELEKLVSELKTSLKKRDDLIVGIVDSLMPQLKKEQTQLSSEERGQIYIEAERNNVLANVKRSLQDNIRFIRITALEPTDLNEIRMQQQDFLEFWQDTGLKLVDIYAKKNERSGEIKEIDSLFTLWNKSLGREAWTNIKTEFGYNDINLVEFVNGDEFNNVLNSFIDDEIKNIGVKSLEESEQTYTSFADSTWYKVVKSKWIPYLMENDLLTVEQKKSIEDKISDWKGRLTPASFDWIYILVAVIAVIGVGVMYKKRTFKTKDKPI